MRIRKGDRVTVLQGKDRGKTGEVMRAMPRDKKVIVGTRFWSLVSISPSVIPGP